MSVATSEASFVASVAAVCAAYRSVSWKVLLSAGLVYGAAYAAERLAWTGRAKERATKRQFAAFVAASGLGSEWRTHLADLCREQACCLWLFDLLQLIFLNLVCDSCELSPFPQGAQGAPLDARVVLRRRRGRRQRDQVRTTTWHSVNQGICAIDQDLSSYHIAIDSRIRSEKNRLDAEEEELSETIRRANDVIEDTNEVEKKLKAMKRYLE